MAVQIPYRRDMAFEYGRLEPVAPGLRRIVAQNPSAFTFHGTGTYVVGEGRVAVIDPGPDDPAHIDALLAGLGGERVSHILVTHTHHDHSPGAAPLRQATGAPTFGFGPHGAGRPEAAGQQAVEGGDLDFVPDRRLVDGDVVAGPGWTIEAVHTPGHTSNHLCFSWREPKVLFTGDHVMGWSTSVITPPDGDMGDYMESLRRLLSRDEETYWPTHGPAIIDPRTHVEAFIAHRGEREAQLLGQLAAGPATIMDMVPTIYAGVDPALYPAAARSSFAHLLHLHDQGRVRAEPGPGLDARWSLA
ncbi:MBL fold metallo-hydrolase [Zavarzinia compransoris]|uniref:MBL fold metallo-hydrolase n=1 Tax=Zavarzinia marina TaxID=2911065 RepID=UPI001F291A3B|nr:MBL fold metallo-hydrolase [Zavarzinia marina]MCF4166050.1 MBL fold metallo-hydrolase [Zavarzinia marina]